MAGVLENFFHLKEHGTDIKTEVMAGLVTFMTVAYIIVVNPAILEAAGIPFGPSLVATILSAVFGTLIMGVYAKKPIAIAPYMGENAFVAYTVVGVLGYPWQTALGAVFISGVLFTILTISGFRDKMIDAVPNNLKYSFVAGLGLFITFIGLVNAGIVSLGVEGSPLHVGALDTMPVALAVLGFLLISVLMIKNIKGSILIGIIATALLGFVTGVSHTPDSIVSMPPSLAPIFLQLDIVGALSWGFFAVILTMFTMDLMDTMGTLVGVSMEAGYMDEEGNLPDMEKPFLADSLATVFAAIAGTTTTGAYIESATGIKEGGRTGLTAVVVALLFMLGLFFYPLFSAIPAAATAPALIIVGFQMMTSIKKIDMNDLTEMVPAMAVIILMSFTYNLGIGLCAGFVLFPLFKVVSGKGSEVKPIAWGLFVLCTLFFIFYPY
ncbi:NCS2 family permease [Methanohalophilus portucalensis]|uniref:NCS2 family permease n=2 Tax=Methanohalophilus portucalensis TaxID=39664 RepID=A0A1L9C4T8_9EURY|nr:NCS2 family permease [Methanohalophilus portucalensis]ATU08200.1 guanine permease [Methanohalophilus portucalensis]OJH49503.1 xanthine/uracil/vitamin C permease [Methanohalophilus portucalensis FDF-1]RNI13634.1 NCS2 family permease [Methanohalophilus portucalensis FDF-1]SMH35707.1 putative MFS transporter, AGZA family, xanthine/uracil permease [Methanohalophilus portucalensis FDF-1]